MEGGSGDGWEGEAGKFGHREEVGEDKAKLEAGVNVCFVEDCHQGHSGGMLGVEVIQEGIFVDYMDVEAGRAGEGGVEEGEVVVDDVV